MHRWERAFGEDGWMAEHFVLLETGANQAFVFASNKQVVNVGASDLIWRVGND